MSFDVPFIRPVFPEPEVIGADFAAIVESNWYTNFGPREREFANRIAAWVGEGYQAVTFANATLGLMAVLQGALGRGNGTRQVIIPSFTFAAGAHAIEWAGYKPLFVDIDVDSFQPSFDVTLGEVNDVAGILMCNTFGIGNQRIHEWEELARELGVPLVVDSAAGFGSRYADGRPVGSAGTAEVFSFHATKPFAIGEGGAVVTRDSALAEQLLSFQNFGFLNGLGAGSLGLNGKLQEMNAAIGLRQLETFPDALMQRQSVVREYMERLANTGVQFPIQIENSSVCFASMLFPTQVLRDSAMAEFLAAGVEVRAYYAPPLHRQPHFATVGRHSDLANTDEVGGRILSVPVHQNMARADKDRIIEVIQLVMAS